VNAAATVTGLLTANGGVNTTDLVASSSVSSGGNVNVGNNLNVTANGTITGNLTATDLNATNIVTGVTSVQAGTISGSGISALNPNPSGPGYVSFHLPVSGTRCGYVGQAGAGGYLQLETEGSFTGYEVTGNLKVDGSTSIGSVSTGALTCTSISDSGTLSVTGTSSLTGNTTIAGTLGVTGDVTLNSAYIGLGTGYSMIFGSTTALAVMRGANLRLNDLGSGLNTQLGSSTNAVSVMGNQTVAGTLGVTGTTTLGTTNTGAITATGAISNGTNTLTTGAITSSGNFSNGSNTLTTGAIGCGAITSSGGLVVNGSGTYGLSTGGTLTCNNAQCLGGLQVTSTSTLTGAVTASTQVDTPLVRILTSGTYDGSVGTRYTSAISGAVKNYVVLGAQTANGCNGWQVDQSLIIGNILYVIGGSTMSGNTTINGTGSATTTIGNGTSATTVGGTLTVSGGITQLPTSNAGRVFAYNQNFTLTGTYQTVFSQLTDSAGLIVISSTSGSQNNKYMGIFETKSGGTNSSLDQLAYYNFSVDVLSVQLAAGTNNIQAKNTTGGVYNVRVFLF
jgi:hypothetical protein